MKIQQRRSFVLLLGSATALAACGGGGGNGGSNEGADKSPPSTSSFVPANGSANVARSVVIEIRFDEPVSAADGSIVVSSGSIPISGRVEIIGGNTVRFAPTRPLVFGQTYKVDVTSGVKDSFGNAAAASSASFVVKARNPSLGLGAFVLQQIIYEGFGPAPAFDGFKALADHGVEWARTQVTTFVHPELRSLPVSRWRELGWHESYWCCLEMSAAVLQRAAQAGLRLQVGFFLSHVASNAGVQLRPPEWRGLDVAALSTKIEEHSRSVAAYYASLGLNVEIFELGSECDFRFCGYDLSDLSIPDGVDWSTSPQWMYDNLWSKYVPLLQAAIRGIKSVYPTARIALHVAAFGYSPGNVDPLGFLRRMIDAGVDYNIAGLSYPYPYGSPPVSLPFFSQPEFISCIDGIRAMGREVQILEFNYPSGPNSIFRPPASAYPYSPEGQAAFVGDLAAAVRGRVSRINYWSADVFPGINSGLNPEIEISGLFSSASATRPSLGVINSIAEGERLG